MQFYILIWKSFLAPTAFVKESDKTIRDEHLQQLLESIEGYKVRSMILALYFSSQ